MIILKNQRRSNLRRLQLCILPGTLIVLLLGLAIVRNSEAQKLEADRIEQQETKVTDHQVQEAPKAEGISEQDNENRAAAYEQISEFQRIKELANGISRKAAELEDLSKKYTMNHPEMIRLKEEMDQLLVQIQKTSKSLNAMREKR